MFNVFISFVNSVNIFPLKENNNLRHTFSVRMKYKFREKSYFRYCRE